MKHADIAEGWTIVPGQEFADEGGLYAVNRDWFWPKGWALTGRKWDLGRATAEDLRDALAAVIPGWIRDTPEVAVPDYGDLTERLAKAMEGTVMDGFVITATVPPETVRSALDGAGEAKVAAKAAVWIGARLDAIAAETGET